MIHFTTQGVLFVSRSSLINGPNLLGGDGSASVLVARQQQLGGHA